MNRVGRFEVGEWADAVIGRGAYAAVFQAFDPILQTPVALKVLADHHSLDPDIRARFLREARLLRRLAGDRLVPVHDVGELDSGQPYLVMELLPRGTLADRLDAIDAPPDPDDVRWLISEMSACLQAVHRHGVVHRDVKPSNLLLRGQPLGAQPRRLRESGDHLLLADFGLAKDLNRSSSISELSVVGGTTGYVPPEFHTNPDAVDHRADIYAASVVVERVYGSHPVPPPIAKALQKGQAPDPNDRYQTAADWERGLLDALGGSEPDAAEAKRSRSKLIGVSIVLAVVAAAAVIAMVALASRTNDPTIAGPSTLIAGESREYTFEDEATDLVWAIGSQIVPSGRTVRVTPVSPGRLDLSVEGVDSSGGEVAASRRLQVDPSPDAPEIAGPDSVALGERAEFSAEASIQDVTYYWTGPSGDRVDGPVLAVTPKTAGSLTLVLTQTEGSGRQLRVSRTIDVRG